MDFIMDCYPLEFHQEHEVGAIEVNYVNEISTDETLVIGKAAYADGAPAPHDYFELSSSGDGRTAIKVAIEFRKRK
jgi:hypothetical protein